MLGLILIFAIGSFFYKLANEFDKNKWLWAIVGIVCYYAGTILMGVVIGVIIGLNNGDVDVDDAFMYSLMAIPVGILFCVILYFILRKSWSKEQRSGTDALDSGEMWK